MSSKRAATKGRPKTGSIVTWSRKNGDVGFGVKFSDQHGVRQYERCGLASEGWSRRRAEIELANFQALVRAGLYTPTADVETADDRDPKFGQFARSFLVEHAVEIRPNSRAFYDGLLEHQLAPYFAELRLSQITWSSVDTYKKQRLMVMHRSAAARAEGGISRASTPKLSERTINHSINLLAMILDEAARRPTIALESHPARDRKLRVKVQATRTRDWLEPDEVMSLLEAAEEIDTPVGRETDRKAQEVRRLRDREKLTVKQVAEQLGISEGGVCFLYERRRRPIVSPRRAIIAMLACSGTRNTELCDLTWQELDFHHSKIRISRAKTNKGVREIDMTPWLCGELRRYRDSLAIDPAPDDPVFPTRNGTFRNKDTLNRNVIGPVQRGARDLRAERGLPSLPTRLSAHMFRRTYATFMAEAGAPPRYVQRQLGHGSARLTLEVYTRVSDSQDRRRLGRAFDELMAGAVPEQTDQLAFSIDSAANSAPAPSYEPSTTGLTDA